MLDQLSNLQQRLVLSSVGIFCLLVAVYLSYEPVYQSLFVILIISFIVFALKEYYQIAQAKGFHPLFKIGLIGTAFYGLAVFLQTQSTEWDHLQSFWNMLPEIVLGSTIIASFIYYFIKGSDPFVNLSITLFGILYLTIPLSCLLFINYFPSKDIVHDGRWVLLFLLIVTKITDTSAFFIGRKFGKNKLSPYISPKKTWEGAIGGLAGSLVATIALYIFFQLAFNNPPLNLPFWKIIILGIFLSITAQFGDLAESLLKRDGGVKDSSKLPGLGGILDIVDSLVFTSPLMYIFLKVQQG